MTEIQIQTFRIIAAAKVNGCYGHMVGPRNMGRMLPDPWAILTVDSAHTIAVHARSNWAYLRRVSIMY